MNKILFVYTLLILTSILEVSSQTEKTNKLNAQLIDIHIVSDGFSRYSEPKISPTGTKILTTRNLDTLVYIDLIENKEIVLLENQRFPYYCWVDTNTIYYYAKSREYPSKKIELGKITISPFSKRIEHLFTNENKSSRPSGRIPYLKNGKHEIYPNLVTDRVYRINQGNEIEITHETGVYYKFIISNNEERVIIHKNDGKAYNYDFSGTGEYNLVTGGSINSWSPDDSYLLYCDGFEEDGGICKYELYICTPDGKMHQQLTFSDKICEFDPDWAKNSNDITFIGHLDYQIYKGEIVLD